MRSMLFFVALLACTAVSLGVLSRQAGADTLSFASGVESNGGAITCFGWSTAEGEVGLFKTTEGNCNKHYFVPLYWRNFYTASTNRTVTVRGRRPSAADELPCLVMVYDSQGFLVSRAAASFPVTGAEYGTVSLTVNNVTASSTSFVVCTPWGEGARALSISWSP